MKHIHPIRLEASLHETIWGGRRLERNGWKRLPEDKAIGEAWETELNTVAQNGLYAGMTLKALVDEFGTALLGEQCVATVGMRFPLLAKFIDANDRLSVQVHPDDAYASRFEQGKLGKTEFWYVLDATPGATIVYGFKASTSRVEVQQAIEQVRLEELLHSETVVAGDIIFVPAGTVHAIGAGVLLYEVQEYSDITYRLYDYGRKDAAGKTRELHVEKALNVSHYEPSRCVKKQAAVMEGGPGYSERCLVACRYFVTREVTFEQPAHSEHSGYMKGETRGSCIILTSIGAQGRVRYGNNFADAEGFGSGQTLVLPAALGKFRIEGNGRLLLSYVPEAEDEAWRMWREQNRE